MFYFLCYGSSLIIISFSILLYPKQSADAEKLFPNCKLFHKLVLENVEYYTPSNQLLLLLFVTTGKCF